MRIAAKALTSSLAGAVALMGVASLPTSASAGNGGSIALGALGGFAAGSILGGALSGPRYYAPPPQPVYGYSAYYPAYECVQRRVWGPYGWHWISEC